MQTSKNLLWLQTFISTFLYTGGFLLVIILYQLFSSVPSRSLYVLVCGMLIIGFIFLMILLWNAYDAKKTPDLIKANKYNTKIDVMTTIHKIMLLFPFILIIAALIYSVYLFSSYTTEITLGHTSVEYYTFSKISISIFLAQVLSTLYWMNTSFTISSAISSTSKDVLARKEVLGIFKSNWYTISSVCFGTANIILVILMALKLSTSTADG
jgi:magnesium-transporting ATPase (P-type)